MSDSVAIGNFDGIIFVGGGNTTITRVIANNNQNGIYIVGDYASVAMNTTIEDSVASNNSYNGITVQSSSSVHPVVMVRNSVVSNNQNGLSSNVGGSILLARTAVTGNSASGVLLNGGPIYSYGDNNINQNLPDVAGGALTPYTTK